MLYPVIPALNIFEFFVHFMGYSGTFYRVLRTIIIVLKNRTIIDELLSGLSWTNSVFQYVTQLSELI